MASEGKRAVKLYYAGEVFDLPEEHAHILDDVGDGEATQTIKLNLGGGKWLTIVVGPGIPAAVLEAPVSRPVMRGF